MRLTEVSKRTRAPFIKRAIYFLSARYGLVAYDTPIDNYEEKLTRVTDAKRELLESTAAQLPASGRVDFLGGRLYHRWLQHVRPKAVHLSAGCRGMGYINQLVKNAVDNKKRIVPPA